LKVKKRKNVKEDSGQVKLGKGLVEQINESNSFHYNKLSMEGLSETFSSAFGKPKTPTDFDSRIRPGRYRGRIKKINRRKAPWECNKK